MSISILKQLGAAAVLTAISCAPAPAQLVISEPCYCAQFYPNANCQNKGPGNPTPTRITGCMAARARDRGRAVKLSAWRQSGPADAIRPTRPLIFAAFVAHLRLHRIQAAEILEQTALD